MLWFTNPNQRQSLSFPSDSIPYSSNLCLVVRNVTEHHDSLILGVLHQALLLCVVQFVGGRGRT